MLVDSFGRVHRNLRISVTDRCNIRCCYCMPHEAVKFKPRRELLTFEEIERFVHVVVRLGVNRLRITGGEPLVRAELPRLVAALAHVPGVEDLAMTTNGILLADFAPALKQAGLRRLNISLDTLREDTFREITRRQGLDRVLEGLRVAQRLGFEKIRLNAVVLRGVTEDDLVPLADFARQQDVEVRFLEFMPLDADRQWADDRVVTGAETRARIEAAYGPLVPAERPDPSQPAVDFRFADGRGRIGLISPVSQPFCHACNRLRITAEGQVRNCLFSTSDWDARKIMRNGGSDEELGALVRACIQAKKTGHGIDSPAFVRPARAMYQIGG
jgi:GTP 3',8-cyclase